MMYFQLNFICLKISVILKPYVSLGYCLVSQVFLNLAVVLFCILNTEKQKWDSFVGIHPWIKLWVSRIEQGYTEASLFSLAIS